MRSVLLQRGERAGAAARRLQFRRSSIAVCMATVVAVLCGATVTPAAADPLPKLESVTFDFHASADQSETEGVLGAVGSLYFYGESSSLCAARDAAGNVVSCRAFLSATDSGHYDTAICGNGSMGVNVRLTVWSDEGQTLLLDVGGFVNIWRADPWATAGPHGALAVTFVSGPTGVDLAAVGTGAATFHYGAGRDNWREPSCNPLLLNPSRHVEMDGALTVHVR